MSEEKDKAEKEYDRMMKDQNFALWQAYCEKKSECESLESRLKEAEKENAILKKFPFGCDNAEHMADEIQSLEQRLSQADAETKELVNNAHLLEAKKWASRVCELQEEKQKLKETLHKKDDELRFYDSLPKLESCEECNFPMTNFGTPRGLECRLCNAHDRIKEQNKDEEMLLARVDDLKARLSHLMDVAERMSSILEDGICCLTIQDETIFMEKAKAVRAEWDGIKEKK